MTPLPRAAIGVLLLASVTLDGSAADRHFDGLVRDVAHHYGVRPTRVPMMSVVSLCIRLATHGGVKGLRVVEFDNLKAAINDAELNSMIRHHLGPKWQPFIKERDTQAASESLIFVREKGDAIKIMIADYDHGELDVVRMELSGDALAKWMKDPQGEAHHYNAKAALE